MLCKPFDRELWIETARLRQCEFCLGVVPLRGLSSRQKGVGKIGPVPYVYGSSQLQNARIRSTPANLTDAQYRVPKAADWIARA